MITELLEVNNKWKTEYQTPDVRQIKHLKDLRAHKLDKLPFEEKRKKANNLLVTLEQFVNAAEITEVNPCLLRETEILMRLLGLVLHKGLRPEDVFVSQADHVSNVTLDTPVAEVILQLQKQTPGLRVEWDRTLVDPGRFDYKTGVITLHPDAKPINYVLLHEYRHLRQWETFQQTGSKGLREQMQFHFDLAKVSYKLLKHAPRNPIVHYLYENNFLEQDANLWAGQQLGLTEQIHAQLPKNKIVTPVEAPVAVDPEID